MTQTNKISVTAAVPIKNEEANLAKCLSALDCFHEVVVIDSSSTDKSQEIAKSFGATFLNFHWNGSFPKKRNWCLRNYEFQTEWVLFVDADEVVSPLFCQQLHQAIQTQEHVGFWLNYTNYFMGKKLKYGVAQRKLACFKVGAGEYEKIDEDGWSKLDMEVHEHPVLKGSIGEISASIDHCDFSGLARFLERHIDYAKWESQRYELIKDQLERGNHNLTGRQLFKYKNVEKTWFSQFYFLYTFIFKLGILDGRAGYQYANYKKWYFQTVQNLIREQ